MYTIDFNNPVHAHFIGIGGISMSGFAELLHSMGFTVTGSDRAKSTITEHLETLGIHPAYEQVAANITDDIDVVIYTAAIHPDNPEYAECVRRGLPMLERAELVGQVMKNYSTAVAVAGTHGKTTTTSIASHLFLAAGLDPTISVGGILPAINGNIRIGHSKNFITEACEYTNSFLKFSPTIGIILNIEEDHMDFFHDIGEIRSSFRRFAELLPEDGTLIINADIDNVTELTDGLKCRVLTYSINSTADGSIDSTNDGHIENTAGAQSDCIVNYAAEDIKFDDNGYPTFNAIVRNLPGKQFTANSEKALGAGQDSSGASIDGSSVRRGPYALHVPGIHNVGNTLAAIALADTLGIDDSAIKTALNDFHGTERRFEYKGQVNGFTIIDDYAHHPTEIRATLSAAANYPHRELWVIFQPHTYSRTKAFLQDFADALSMADHVLLTDIYAAREPDPGDISSRDIAALIEEKHKDVIYFGSFDEAEKFIQKNLVADDLLITMGPET